MPRARTLPLVFSLPCQWCPMAGRCCSPGCPMDILFMFLPLHNTAQILSSINIIWGDEGAVRLEGSPGLHLSPSVQGTSGTAHKAPRPHPQPVQPRPEIRSIPHEIGFFCSDPLQSFSQPFPISVLLSLRSPWDPSIQSLGFHSSP